MKNMNRRPGGGKYILRAFMILMMAVGVAFMPAAASAQSKQQVSTKRERNCITEGNKLFNSGKYRQAMLKYQEALKLNPSSAVGRYNLGLSQVHLGSNPADTTQAAKEMLQNGCKALQEVAQMGREKPKLAAMANYNLGNVAFLSEDYSNALNMYKQALRLNPDDEAARRNLRITQLKLQNQNQDQNQDQNKDQNQDQDQNKDQNKDQNDNKDQDQNKDNNQDQQKNQEQQQDINQQTADQILKAMENKENQIRSKMATGQNGDKSKGRNRSRRNW